MPTWPVSLPQAPLLAGYEETIPETSLRTRMDAGPAKVRRRFSAGVRNFSTQMVMTVAQSATFDTFYVTTLQGGALAFDFDHPRTGATLSFRFAGPPSYQSASGSYRVSMSLEALP